MASIKFSKEQKENMVQKVQNYFDQELDQKIGQFDAEFLLDFFSEEFGSFYYNQALSDAQVILESKIEDLNNALYEIEKPINL